LIDNPLNPVDFAFPAFLLTIDVEDWFQVENFKQWISIDSWPSRELRVERNTLRMLDLLDEKGDGAKGPARATFFVLGCIAEWLPGLVREIHNRGHEVASHGYHHHLASGQDHVELKKDLLESRKLLEDITGSPVHGYRAPSFSIDDDRLKVIEECGYVYDSSLNSFTMHGRYGQASLSDKSRLGVAIRVSDGFFELPISNIRIGDTILPLGGGAYFRLMPLSFFKIGVRRILKKENAYLFYIHPWEIDPEQPRVHEAALSFKFRHYSNLKKNYRGLSKLLDSFSDCSFISCSQYIENISRSVL
jgi:polysaccharide deacetylase family protein (PEP-CTERM system associated)